VVVESISEAFLDGEHPVEMVKRLAVEKGKASAARPEGQGTIVSADTVVVLAGTVLGKPRDAVEARSMLQQLRAGDHEVVTGVAVLDTVNDRLSVTATTSIVAMRDYSNREIDEYVGSGDPFDKAGGYAVQSERFHPAAEVRGCYLNVVGLPLCALRSGLCAVGYHVPPVPSRNIPAVCQSCEQGDILIAGWP
jgi:MAF protein